MTEPCSQPSSRCSRLNMIGGLSAADFSAIDALGVRLLCLDGRFAASVREVGRIIGQRIAANCQHMSFTDALSAMLPACGLDTVVASRFMSRSDDHAELEINGCSAALGWQIPNVGRTVCGFDAGLFEGFLVVITGDESLTVAETRCLGLGGSACHFLVQRCASAEVFDAHC